MEIADHGAGRQGTDCAAVYEGQCGGIVTVAVEQAEGGQAGQQEGGRRGKPDRAWLRQPGGGQQIGQAGAADGPAGLPDEAALARLGLLLPDGPRFRIDVHSVFYRTVPALRACRR
ncbi:MAG: hypothetical protein IT508_00625 [Burkholderiaceae bacterium]|nr:hypothetical protein [Burkholderiaceae bacterium]